MPQPTSELEKKAIEEAPKGTWAVLLIYTVLMVAGWAAMYFGFFLPHGSVH